MKVAARRAVDPIIATLLLIAISVAAGILVYVYVNSLSGGLTQSGGQQMSEQLSMDSYAFAASGANNLVINLRNTGSASVTVDSGAMFYDGVLTADTHTGPGSGTSCFALGTSYQVTVGTPCYIVFHIIGATAGTGHLVKVVTVSGGTFVFPVTAGRAG
jgi:hypothetical protein